jgi:hypothetical protein
MILLAWKKRVYFSHWDDRFIYFGPIRGGTPLFLSSEHGEMIQIS